MMLDGDPINNIWRDPLRRGEIVGGPIGIAPNQIIDDQHEALLANRPLRRPNLLQRYRRSTTRALMTIFPPNEASSLNFFIIYMDFIFQILVFGSLILSMVLNK